MATLFLDTEFNGHGGRLISMAVVSDEGHEWYEVMPLPSIFDPWVYENVLPVLAKESLDGPLFRLSFRDFISQFKNPTIICDWHADVQNFCAMLAGEDYGSSLDFGCTIKLLSGPSNIVPDMPHNALSDARALRDYYLKKAA